MGFEKREDVEAPVQTVTPDDTTGEQAETGQQDVGSGGADEAEAAEKAPVQADSGRSPYSYDGPSER